MSSGTTWCCGVDGSVDGRGVGCGAEVGAAGRAASGWRVLARSHLPVTRPTRYCHMMFQPDSTVIIDKHEIIQPIVSNNHEFVHSPATSRAASSVPMENRAGWSGSYTCSTHCSRITPTTTCPLTAGHRMPCRVAAARALLLDTRLMRPCGPGAWIMATSRDVVWRGCVRAHLGLGRQHLSQPARRLPCHVVPVAAGPTLPAVVDRAPSLVLLECGEGLASAGWGAAAGLARSPPLLRWLLLPCVLAPGSASCLRLWGRPLAASYIVTEPLPFRSSLEASPDVPGPRQCLDTFQHDQQGHAGVWWSSRKSRTPHPLSSTVCVADTLFS